MNTVSWSAPTTPLPTEADPRAWSSNACLATEGLRSSDRRNYGRAQVFSDWLTGDMATLQRKLGSGDRTRVSNYLDSIREVERRIQRAEAQDSEALPAALERPVGAPQLWDDHVKLMFDLQVLALQADITRVITFQLAREVSTRTYPQIGVPDAHHPMSHHANDPEKLVKLAKINAYHVSLFAYFLDKLKSTPDGNGSLLDHSMYLYGSGMGNPNIHDHSKLPILVAGGASGQLKGGRHIVLPENTPMTNVLLTMLDKAGVTLDKFADSTGKIQALLGDPISF